MIIKCLPSANCGLILLRQITHSSYYWWVNICVVSKSQKIMRKHSEMYKLSEHSAHIKHKDQVLNFKRDPHQHVYPRISPWSERDLSFRQPSLLVSILGLKSVVKRGMWYYLTYRWLFLGGWGVEGAKSSMQVAVETRFKMGSKVFFFLASWSPQGKDWIGQGLFYVSYVWCFETQWWGLSRKALSAWGYRMTQGCSLGGYSPPRKISFHWGRKAE